MECTRFESERWTLPGTSEQLRLGSTSTRACSVSMDPFMDCRPSFSSGSGWQSACWSRGRGGDLGDVPPPTLKYATPLQAARMAEKKSRAAARKIKDKWKAKVWYNLLAPEMFNKQLLGETPTDTPDKLVGRVTEVTVQDLTGDFSKMHIKLQFRVNAVQGRDAHTEFVGHDMTSDYIRRLPRRKRTRTDLTVDVVTKDHWNVRVKPMAITDRRIQTSKQRVIRTIMAKLVADVAAKQSIGEFVKGVISGDLAKTIAQGCKPIHPVSRVEVRKSEVWAMGEVPPPAEPPAAEAPSPAPPAPEEPAPAPSPAPAPEELTPEELPPDEI